MPAGAWYHVIWNTHSSWLPGDPRGFRNRNHRIHSSGDYKQRPPQGEHEGLLTYNRSRAVPPTVIAPPLRPVILESVLDSFSRQIWTVVALSVDAHHVHVLASLSPEYEEARKTIGKFKTYASLAVREQLPGKVWSHGCTLKRINSNGHWDATRVYVTDKQERGAYAWDIDRGAWWVQ